MSSEFSTGTATRSRASEVEDFFRKKLDQRRPHERQWYVNRAFLRGQQFVAWSEADQTLAVPDAPLHRVRLPINRVMSKDKARKAKFLKNRPIPVCVPATMEVKDRLNARLSTKAIEYEWRRARLESKYREVLDWATSMGHGYMWFHFDPTRPGRMATKGLNGATSFEVAPLGDIVVEVVDPFQVVVEDPNISYIGDQPRIGRLRLMKLSTVKANERWAKAAADITAGSHTQEAFLFKDRIGTLTSNTLGVGSSRSAVDMAHEEEVLLFELYEKPCPAYPKGRYTITCAGIELEDNQELPHNFSDLENPFPCVDFLDFPQAGQYWITTVVEQMISLQREYNLIRSKIAEHLRVLAHPKILVAKQHQLAAGAWTSDSGEIVEYVALPGIPPPTPWIPPPISADTWRILELLIKEFDDVSHIYPEAEGRVGNATSGFQTNLLQEATDAVHGPDIRSHELLIEEVGVKVRRMIKSYWDSPRLITVAGKNLSPEAFVFSGEQVDDFADIRVEAGSGLPTLKAAKIQMISDLWKAGLLGNPNNPEDVRHVRAMLEMGTLEDQYDYDRQDEELARLENSQLEDGQPLNRPDAFENHEIHYRIHSDVLKSASSKLWQPNVRLALIAHLIYHVRYINPQSAVMLATEYQLPQVAQEILASLQQAAAIAGPAPAPAPAGGAPEEAGAAPPPPPAQAGPA